MVHKVLRIWVSPLDISIIRELTSSMTSLENIRAKKSATHQLVLMFGSSAIPP